MQWWPQRFQNPVIIVIADNEAEDYPLTLFLCIFLFSFELLNINLSIFVLILELMSDRKMEALELRFQNSGFLSMLHTNLLSIYFLFHLQV